MVSVSESEKIILAQVRDYGTFVVPLEDAPGYVLAEDLLADRDMPPCNRVTMDGIAIMYESFEKGIRTFRIAAIQAAGDAPINTNDAESCTEIMTGAALPVTLDTVIRYEDIEIRNGKATILTGPVTKGRNVHLQGSDKQKGEVVAHAGQVINPPLVGIAAAIGKTELLVKKLPRVIIISTGDELTGINETPNPYQVRRSNSYTIKAVLQRYKIQPQMLHLADNLEQTKITLTHCLKEYDVIILSGGISMGKFDYIPAALEDLSVQSLFYKVKQRPGKPFWFGTHTDGAIIFAFPGNPVSTFLCLHRYCIPWLQNMLGIPRNDTYAILGEDVTFIPPLQYFLQVRTTGTDTGQIIALPLQGNGSGDFANLADSNAFMELPADRDNFQKGEVFKVWHFD